MSDGISKGSVHQEFKDRLEELQKQAGELADSLIGEGQRPWQIPEKNSDIDLFDIAGLHGLAWERGKINNNYLDCMKNGLEPGTVGDVVSLKSQIDYMAVEERAYRFRHASICRCHHLAHGRRRGHDIGPVFVRILDQADSAIIAGRGGKGVEPLIQGEKALVPTAEII